MIVITYKDCFEAKLSEVSGPCMIFQPVRAGTGITGKKTKYNKTNVLVVLERKSSTRLITSTLTVFIIPDRRVEAGSGEGQVFPSKTCSAGVCVQRAIYISIQGNREWNSTILNCTETSKC